MDSVYNLKEISSTRAFSCTIKRFSHTSPTLGNLTATFSVILPPTKAPPLYWLSGLTCTDENFIIKAGAARYAAEHNVAIICPDTSPRGAGVEGEGEGWDFGTGAGFYVDATTEAWKPFYNMYSYVLKELPKVVEEAVGSRVDGRKRGISGHSMGGMGALVLALRNVEEFVSVSAFAPISNPMNCGWGEKCFTGYLGKDRESWRKYDPTELLNESCYDEILIDQGEEDGFLKEQLKVAVLANKAEKVGQKLSVCMQEGYDHSYFFVQSFIGKHVQFHAQRLHNALAEM